MGIGIDRLVVHGNRNCDAGIRSIVGFVVYRDRRLIDMDIQRRERCSYVHPFERKRVKDRFRVMMPPVSLALVNVKGRVTIVIFGLVEIDCIAVDTHRQSTVIMNVKNGGHGEYTDEDKKGSQECDRDRDVLSRPFHRHGGGDERLVLRWIDRSVEYQSLVPSF